MPKKQEEFDVYEKDKFFENPFLKRFLEIPDCPEKVYTLGSFPDSHLHTLAIVGSRDISSYGKDVLEKIISGLAGSSVCIISGLAIGVDGEAHRLALKHGIHTVAVPGSGLSYKAIYPKSNKEIAKKIVESGGLLLSELSPETEAAPWTFPKRNRLMAALADAVLVVEAGFKSGTLITARLALEYNKDVLAVPGSVFSKGAEGTNNLIANGAKLVICADDILECFGIFKVDSTPEESQKQYAAKVLENLSDTEKEILSLIKEPISKDKIISSSGKDAGDILVTLTMLEWRGFIKEEGGIIRRVK